MIHTQNSRNDSLHHRKTNFQLMNIHQFMIHQLKMSREKKCILSFFYKSHNRSSCIE